MLLYHQNIKRATVTESLQCSQASQYYNIFVLASQKNFFQKNFKKGIDKLQAVCYYNDARRREPQKISRENYDRTTGKRQK